MPLKKMNSLSIPPRLDQKNTKDRRQFITTKKDGLEHSTYYIGS